MFSSPKDNTPYRFDRESQQLEWQVRRLPGVIYTTYDKPVRHVADPTETTVPCIVVTGGGMCDGGMVLGYLENLLRRESTTLLFTGYLSPATIGGKLLQYSKLPPDERRRSSEQLEWPDPDRKKPAHRVPLSEATAHIEQLPGYSGHADQPGLLDWLFSTFKDRLNLAAPTIFITHGGESQRLVRAAGARVDIDVLGARERDRALATLPQNITASTRPAIGTPLDAYGLPFERGRASASSTVRSAAALS